MMSDEAAKSKHPENAESHFQARAENQLDEGQN